MSTDVTTDEQKAEIDRIIARENLYATQPPLPWDDEADAKAVTIAYQRVKMPPPVDETGEVCIIRALNPKEGLFMAASLVQLHEWLLEKGYSTRVGERSYDGWYKNKPPEVAHLDLRRDILKVRDILKLPMPTRERVEEVRRAACYGQDESHWTGFYSAMEYRYPESLNRQPNGECVLDGFQEMRRFSWWFAFDRGVIVSQRPLYSHFDDRYRLVSPDGVSPAREYQAPTEELGYGDDYNYWWLHGDGWPWRHPDEMLKARPGSTQDPSLLPSYAAREGRGLRVYMRGDVQVNSRIVERRFTPEEAISEENSEFQRIMFEVYGEEDLIRDLGVEPIDDDPKHGKLYKLTLASQREPQLLLRVEDSTPIKEGPLTGQRKVYFLRPHPECIPLAATDDIEGGVPQELTARNARASTMGLRGEDLPDNLPET